MNNKIYVEDLRCNLEFDDLYFSPDVAMRLDDTVFICNVCKKVSVFKFDVFGDHYTMEGALDGD